MADLEDRPEVTRLEVVEIGRHRRWTEDDKVRVVSERLSGPRLGSVTVRRYGIVRSLLATWRRRFVAQAAGGSRLVLAVVVPDSPTGPSLSSRMEIVAVNGRRVMVDAGVDVAALSRVDVLERR
jgi:transposase